MRDFFIKSFEMILAVVLVVLVIAVVVAGLGAMQQQGSLAGIAILLGGTVYVLFVGGMMYLFLGVYHNTRRTAEAVEKLATAQTFK